MTTPAHARYGGYRFPAEIIGHAVWLQFRFPLGLRMVEELLAARGETVRHSDASMACVARGAAVRSCLMLAVQAEGSTVVTVEGLSTEEALTPLQTAFRKHHALQCGFCTPGMLTTAHALLTEEPDADADRIRSALSGNLCRCTGYIPIVEAVLEARTAYQKTDKP
jgi:aerobic-type carbon monoxide dehydrogenase small subunit (CoxS/CutS family)